MKVIFNLSDDCEMYFDPNIDDIAAVCYAYASENGLLSVFFDYVHNAKPLCERFPVIVGKKSICCGDWCIMAN